MRPLHAWLLAVRPKTLSVSVVPVAVGGSLAWAESRAIDWLTLAVILAAALLIQIGTNLHNDAADYERGADTPERLGPQRATAEGWLSARQVKLGAAACFAAALLLGIYLVWLGGWPILLLGLAALAAAYGYTGGPRPIAYTPLGELFVLGFFGIAAVGGSHYLLTGTLSTTALVLGVLVGLPAAAVLVVNNYRDLDTDRRAGKLTLAAYLGRPSTRRCYGLMVILPPLASLPLAVYFSASLPLLLPLLSLPLAVRLSRRLGRTAIGPALNPLLAQTAQLQLVYGLLLSLALLAVHLPQ